MPDKPVAMLRADLTDAQIAYADDAGRYLDTYALRHTAGTRLSYVVRSLGDLHALMRHRTPAMTARYTHARLASMSDAADALTVPRMAR